MELARASFGQGSGTVASWEPAPTVPQRRLVVEARSTAQAHLCIGLPALPRDHPDQWTLELLNTVLGEGSSSRLFLRVREEAGLAYDVHSFQTDYADCGILQVYAGVDPDDIDQTVTAIMAELSGMRETTVPAAELEKARNFLTGRMELRLEEGRHVASWLGSQEALCEQVLTVDEAIERLMAVSADDIQSLAGRLIRDEGMCLAVIAPRRKKRDLDRVLRLP